MCDVFLLLNLESSLYILDKSLLLYMWLHKTTFNLWLAFYCHNMYFEEKNLIILMKSNL
jgi:hypothetical protein